MMAIPSEKDKGKAFSLFWAIVSLTRFFLIGLADH